MSADHDEDEGAFTSVTYKKPSHVSAARGGRNRKGKGKVRERTVSERIEARRAPFLESDYLNECRELLRDALDGPPVASTSHDPPQPLFAPRCPPPTCTVCLGLGSLTESPKSQEQYLLLEALQLELGQLLEAKTEIYDPVFDPRDITYLADQGLVPLTQNHDLTFHTTTLFYMPHCPRSLFDQLLERSWSREGLRRLIILGNRLDMYDDPTHASATSRVKSPFISQAAPLFHIIPLPPTKDHFQAFNDLALQWIPAERLDALPDEFFNCASRDVQSKSEDSGKQRTEVAKEYEDELVQKLARTDLGVDDEGDRP